MCKSNCWDSATERMATLFELAKQMTGVVSDSREVTSMVSAPPVLPPISTRHAGILDRKSVV